MRIAINAIAVQGGGGERYLLNMLKGLCAIGSQHEFWVVLAARHRPLLRLIPAQAHPVVCNGVPHQAWLRMAWEQTVLPTLVRRWRIDLLFAAYNTAVLLSPVPIVLLIQNSNPYSGLPIPWSQYGRARHVALRALGGLSARVARKVVFVSHSSAKVIAPHLAVPASSIRVVHHGWLPLKESDGVGRRLDLKLPDRYILTVSDLQPHKNLEVLLDAFQRLVAEDTYAGDLVIAGGQKDMSSRYARHLMVVRQRMRCSERVHFVGSLPHEMLLPVYRGADLFAFPSLEETFGLPLLEAMGVGVPVVVSDWRLARGGDRDRVNVGPEICGEAAEFFDPTNSASLVEAMRGVLTESARRDELIRMGRARAREFSWDKAAAALLTIFEEAVSPTAVAP